MQSEEQLDRTQNFRLDVPLHDLLTRVPGPPRGLAPSKQPQQFPAPVFPQHPELLGSIEESGDWSPPRTCKWTAGQIYHSMQGWLFPYIRSRVTAGDSHPPIAYLFTEFKCNLDCHYCWAFDNKVKGYKMVNSNTRLWQMVDFMKENHFPWNVARDRIP